MASREGQGLQIAVILFAMLTIVLAITTYIFYAEKEQNKGLTKTANDQKAETEKNFRKVIYQNQALKMMMGIGDVEKAMVTEAGRTVTDELDVPKWLADYDADMALYGENVGAEGARNYRTLPKYLLAAIAKKNSSVVAANGLADEYKKTKDTDVSTEKERAKTAETARDAATTDLAGERTTFNNDRTKLSQDKEKLAADVEKKAAAAKKEREDASAKLAALAVQTSNLQKLDDAQKDVIISLRKESGQTLENPDGKIVWVDQKQQLVWINLGYKDGLSRQATFSVFDQEQNSIFDKSVKQGKIDKDAAAKGELKKNKLDAKGRIEVVRIVGEHQAECRILQDRPSSPILPGDWIQTPIWSPGQVTHFALVGFMDIDGDGISDRDQIRNIIQLNGGVIDAELYDNGTRLESSPSGGKMTVNTRYLVMGAKPTEKTAADAKLGTNYLKEYNKLMQEKSEFGVEEISVQELLDQMGWRAEERKVKIGSGDDNGAFRKRTPGKKTEDAGKAGGKAAPPKPAADAAEEEAPAAKKPAAPATDADPFGG